MNPANTKSSRARGHRPWLSWSAFLIAVFFLLSVIISIARADYVSNGIDLFGLPVIGGNTFDPSNLDIAHPYDSDDFLGWYISFNGVTDNWVETGGNVSFNTVNVANGMSSGGNVAIGGSLSLGPWYDGTDYWDGLLISFYDLGDNATGNISFLGSSPHVTWYWQENGNDTVTTQMTLDERGNLTLFDPVSGNTVAFNPGNMTVTVNEDGELTLPLLSYTDGDNQYLQTDAFTLGNPEGYGMPIMSFSGLVTPFGNFTAPGGGLSLVSSAEGNPEVDFDFANQAITFDSGRSLAVNGTATLTVGDVNFVIGDDATASGAGAMAMGGNSTAPGIGALAFMSGNASGSYAIAIGAGSFAGGNASIAIGGQATANGALAIGGNSTASGIYSTSIGTNVSAQAWGATVIGRYNAPISGNLTTWQSADPAFIVGIGNATVPANGLVIYNNGNIPLNSPLIFANPGYVSPTSSTQPQALQVNGPTVLNGSATLAGNISISQAQGDILMGQFDASNSY